MRSPVALRLVARWLLGAAAVACLTTQAPLAQTSTVDAAAYRQAKNAATATFLDRKRSTKERLAATKDLGYPDNATIPRLLAIGADRSENDDIRWEALRRVRYGAGYREVVLKILADPNDGGEKLDANLIEDLSRRTTFIPPPRVRQQIQGVLRKLLDDKRDKVRLAAYRALVANHDQVAVNVLAESLRKGKDIPVPLAEAIDLIDQNGPVNHIVALRPYLAHSDSQVQANAARALAADPQSRAKIVELARNSAAPAVVRLNALRALAREDREFVGYAIPIVEDFEEAPAIRGAAMTAVAGRMNYHVVAAQDQVRFAMAVEKIAADKRLEGGDAVKLRESAGELHIYLRQAFPEVQKHYQNK